MKFSFILMLMSLLQITAAVYSQTATITVSGRNVTISDVFKTIEEQTGYTVFYKNDQLDVNRHAGIQSGKITVKDALSQMFQDCDCGYTMFDKLIVVTPKNGMQQGIAVTGTVTDGQGIPLPGVNVVVKGTMTGSVTDADGQYRINVPGTDAVLVCSFIGYVTCEVPVGNRTNIMIEMKEDLQEIEEVVVIGYGSVKKKDLTGAVASVDNTLITKQSAANLSQALRGQIPGFNVQQTSGKANATSTVILRGQTSIGKTVQPLVVIDGMPSDWTVFNGLNPNDIERLDVLKDASSTAIYGSRASGGVVLVTTKSGREGKNIISYDGYFGVRTLVHLPKMMNTRQFYRRWQDANLYDGTNTVMNPEELQAIEDNINTDWVGMITRNGMQTSHNVSVSGGGKSESHQMSVGYYKSNGNQKADSYERYSLNLKATGTVFDKLSAGASVYASYTKEAGVDGRILNAAHYLRPWGHPKNPDGTDRLFPTSDETGLVNPVFDLRESYNETKRFFANGNIFLEYKPITGLSVKSAFMPAYLGSRYGSYKGENTTGNNGVAGTSTSSAENSWQFAYTWDNSVSFNKTFDTHSIGLTGLFSIESATAETYSGSVKDISYQNEYWYNLAASTSITGLNSGMNRVVLESYMLRANYGFSEKYLLTLTGRWDGSSKLAPGHQWAFFPSAAIAWRAGEEQFIKNLNVFSNLKFRLSYGVAGNHAVDAYASWPALSTTLYDWDGSPAKGISAAMANKALSWEKSYEYNAGVDIAFFHDRLSATVDLYNKTTKDIILWRNVPIHQGVASLRQNIGSVLNKGIEVSLGSVNFRTKDFSWTTNLNFAVNHNEILDLFGDKKDYTGNKWFIGQPVEVNYDYKFLGIWQLDEADEAARYTERPGMVKRWDKSDDGKFTPDDDYVILGNPYPKWTGGITNNFTYKNFDFSFFIYTRQGEQVLSGFHQFLYSSKENGRRYNIPDISYWTPENPSNKWWAAGQGGSSYSSYQDASFWRIGNITLGYKLPQAWLQRAGIANLRIYLTAVNPFVFTKYEGWDPEWAQSRNVPIGGAVWQAGVNLAFQ